MYCDRIHGQHSYICQNPRRTRTIYKNGTSKITGKQSISETEEMRIQQDDHGIPRTNHQGRTTIDGPSQIKRDQRLAGTNYSQTSQGFLRIWKFLLMLHMKIFRTSTPIKQPAEERHAI